MIKEKRKVGRPTDYKSEYCQMLIEHMAQGHSFESFAAVINKNRDTLYDWTVRHKEFLDAKKEGLDKSLLWFEERGRFGMKQGKDFNATVFIFMMKNMHGWKSEPDSFKHEHSGSLSLIDLVKKTK